MQPDCEDGYNRVGLTGALTLPLWNRSHVGIAGPLFTTPGADFDDDRHLAAQAGYSAGRQQTG